MKILAGLAGAVLLACVASSAAAPVSRAPFATAIETLAQKLEADYVFPRAGADYAKALRTHLAAGDYDGLSDPSAVATRLTADLQAFRSDGHLRVKPIAQTPQGPSSLASASPPPILEAKWIAPGVAYVSFSLMPDDPALVATIDNFLTEHASARALIIDARRDHGGGIGCVDVIFSRLYGARRLAGLYDERAAVADDQQDSPFDGPTFVKVAGPPGYVRWQHWIVPDRHVPPLTRLPVFYLTSRQTGSAAEYMAQVLKSSGRASIVGETTAGADHFGFFVPIGQGLRVFMPWGRTSDPSTGEDWEGKGVAPTIAVPADQALRTALQLAGPA